MSVQSAHLPYYYLNFRLQVFIFSFVIIRYNIFFRADLCVGQRSDRQTRIFTQQIYCTIVFCLHLNITCYNNCMQRIFSISNNNNHKIFYLMGLKFKIKSKYLEQNIKIEKLNKKLKSSTKQIDKMQRSISDMENHYLKYILPRIEKEKFSVIIPTLQKDIDILNMLIESLIEDDFVDEILIIDNSLKGGLTYDSQKVKVLSKGENLFVYPAWNYGIENMRNEYFALLNDDLLLPKNFFAQVSDFIKSTPECGLVGLESSTVIDEKDKNFYEYPPSSFLLFKPIKAIHAEHNHYWGSAIFGRKENYFKTPQDMLVWYGDDYLILKNTVQNKTCYAIHNTKVKHFGGLSSKNSKLDKIKKRDSEIYKEIENSLVNN